MSNSKNTILSKIRNNKPKLRPVPDLPDFKTGSNCLENFKLNASKLGSRILELSSKEEFHRQGKTLFPDAKVIASTVSLFPGNIDLNHIENPEELKYVDVAVIETSLGVAENGSVWVPESKIQHRVLPFITQHLIILINSNNIVENMHEAYNTIKINEEGYGVFIGGPSKTADIEQSLVIGAQGPRSNTIFIYNETLN